jgi:hypothetical protein
MLIEALNDAGISVQLSHDATEAGTFRDAHGHVAITSSDGTELAASSDFQHNRKYYEREERTAALVAEVLSKLPKVAATEEPETGNGGSVTTLLPGRQKSAPPVLSTPKAASATTGTEDCVTTARTTAAELKYGSNHEKPASSAAGALG